jgi:hypothetical protein
VKIPATDPEPVLVVPDGADHIVQTCTRCGLEERAAMEPAAVLLDVMQSFVARHAACALLCISDIPAR